MKTVVIVLLVLALAAVGFIYSGIYDVAATTPDTGLIQWALETTQHRSVHRRAEEVEAPASLDDPNLIRTGLIEYHEMCVVCHGAPGVPISPVGQGLNPSPPELAKESGEEAGELFWVTKNGIKMTGMPAFGVTHTDDEIWAIVAFVSRLPKLSPEEYQAMVKQAGLGPEEEGGEAQPAAEHHTHTHPPGTKPHRD
jgi:mono/diheme cytochrome c family protein